MKQKKTKQYRVDEMQISFKGYFDYLTLKLAHSLQNTTNIDEDWVENLSREVMSRGNAIAVILYNTQDEELLFIEQIRAGAVVAQMRQNADDFAQENAWLLEPVAGCIDLDDSPEKTVYREALEEAGVEIRNLEKIASYYPSPAACDEIIHLYAAEYQNDHCQEFGGLVSEAEDLAIKKLSFAQAQQQLLEGVFNVSTTIMGLQWFFWQKLPKLQCSKA